MSTLGKCSMAFVGLLVLAATAAAAPITLPNRENFNVVNSDTAAISAEQTSGFSGLPASALIMHQEAAWDGGPSPPGGFNELTINLDAVRNIKTIRMFENFGFYGLVSATVETSNDGISWTPQANTASNPNTRNSELVLNSAVNAQYLRITPTQMQTNPDPGNNSGAEEGNRWIIGALRVYGDTGSLTTDSHLDVVSSTAFATTGVAMTFVGSVSITDTPNADFVDDRQNSADPLTRQVIFGLGTGDGFTLAFNQPIEFDRFAFNYSISGTADLGADYLIETSPDGITFNPVATGLSQVHGPNFVDLANSIGTHLRFTYTSTTSGDNRISDFMVFQPIPEPATGTLLMLGLLPLLRRRK